ncbi:MAG: UDP-N-acetylmuramoyl-L-alanyl-D-glutamate--2,6-diaminopimelate ligase [Chitinophagales bacterium]|nr:UDP-N-acetylmuramoyl-L-alanyl-D-glutamate--2,6-diaminopimelate ligase [Chitinophagales bacterium]
MKPLLRDILYGCSIKEVIGSTDVRVKGISFDSRKVKSGSVFIAVKGVNVDGHDFIEQAIENGASIIIAEKLPVQKNEDLTYIKVEHSANALGILADNFYDKPSTKLRLIGITGTNGKTTIASLLYQLFTELDGNVGLISTVRYMIGKKEEAATHTTPDPISLNRLLSDMVDNGCEHCFMEVSSHAIHQERIAGLKFSGAVFTNISHDHLDYHGTFREYINVKKRFFDQLSKDAFSLINMDDQNGRIMRQNTLSSRFGYSLHKQSEFKGKVLESSLRGLVMMIDGEEVYTKLIGNFNAYNLLAVYGVSRLLGVDKMEALTVISKLEAAEGRFDYIVSGKEHILGIVDYAHTPDALHKVLETISKIRQEGNRIIAVVGCGGDRDAAKRPIMAKVACQLSDRVIFTSDNPRSESPESIIEQMEKGIGSADRKKVISIVDRKEAIKTACSFANPEDIVLVAGKGHEKYQEIMGEKLPFDDKKILAEIFKQLDK